MTTKNQNYIELPVQDEIGTPEAGFVSLGFASGKFQGRDAEGDPISFSPTTYSDTVGWPFDDTDWLGSGSEWEYAIYSWDLPFYGGAGDLVVQVRDAAGDLVFGGMNVDGTGKITLSSAVPFTGTAYITGVITTG
jgi:hypothetical protein